MYTKGIGTGGWLSYDELMIILLVFGFERVICFCPSEWSEQDTSCVQVQWFGQSYANCRVGKTSQVTLDKQQLAYVTIVHVL
jgi:hypothetical protein